MVIVVIFVLLATVGGCQGLPGVRLNPRTLDGQKPVQDRLRAPWETPQPDPLWRPPRSPPNEKDTEDPPYHGSPTRAESQGRPLPGGGGRGEGATGRNTSWAYRHVTWSLEDFPDPRTDPVRCGRRQPSMVCDPNRLLTRAEARKLDRAAAAICAQTGCPCGRNCSSTCAGFKVGVAVIPSAAAGGGFRPDDSKPDDIKKGAIWAENLRTQIWKLGTCSEDVILVLDKDEKKVFLSVGELAKGKLTDVCADSIYKDARRHLEEDNIGPALYQMLRDIKSAFDDDFKCEISFSDVMSTGKVIGIIFASIGPVVLIVVIMIFLGPCFSGRGFGGSSGAKHRSYHHQRGYEPADTAMDGRGRGDDT